jgi:hypothetical protein
VPDGDENLKIYLQLKSQQKWAMTKNFVFHKESDYANYNASSVPQKVIVKLNILPFFN